MRRAALSRNSPLNRRAARDPSDRLNKHQQKTEATKGKLLQAAFEIFVRDGFEAARIDDIAAQAGYTRGAYYAHFQSKEDLFFAMLEYESRRHMERIGKALDECATNEERIRTLREFYVKRVVDRQWSILMLEFKLYAIRHPKLRPKLAELHRDISRRVKLEGLASMQSMIPKHHTLRVALQSLLQGLVLENAYDPASITQSEAKKVLRQVFDLLFTPESTPSQAPHRP
jgi:AcrR family transcriptional regulator